MSLDNACHLLSVAFVVADNVGYVDGAAFRCGPVSRIADEDAANPMMAGVAARLETVDPGFVRTRRGARTACATVLSWATLVAVTFVFGVAEPLPIALFGAGACFFGALLVTDPQRKDRVRTFGLASVVSAVAVVVTVELSRPRCGPLRHS